MGPARAPPARIDAPAGRAGHGHLDRRVDSPRLWLSHLVGGYGRGVVFLAAGLLALASVAGASGLRPPSSGALVRNRPPSRWRARRPCSWLGAGRRMWRMTPGGVSSGGSNWSDLGVHLSIAETLNAGANFPPEVPYFSGVPSCTTGSPTSTPRSWQRLRDLLGAGHGRPVSGPVGRPRTPRLLAGPAPLRGHEARRAATIAATLAVFAGGLGWIRLIGDMTVDPAAENAPAFAGDLIGLITHHSYDNQWLTGWPYFGIPSVMGTGLLAHRATTAGPPSWSAPCSCWPPGCRPPASACRLPRPAVLIGWPACWAHCWRHSTSSSSRSSRCLPWRGYRPAAPPRARRAAQRRAAGRAIRARRAVRPAARAPGRGLRRVEDHQPVAVRSPRRRASGGGVLLSHQPGLPFALALAALLMPRLPHRGFLAAWVVGLFVVPTSCSSASSTST